MTDFETNILEKNGWSIIIFSFSKFEFAYVGPEISPQQNVSKQEGQHCPFNFGQRFKIVLFVEIKIVFVLVIQTVYSNKKVIFPLEM